MKLLDYTSEIEIEKLYYNHGVIAYRFNRFGSDFRYTGFSTQHWTFRRFISGTTFESIDIPHHTKGIDRDYNRSKVTLLKFEKDFITFYTIPRNLQRDLYHVDKFDERYSNKTAYELGYHYQPYSNYHLIGLSSKISRKTLKLKRSEIISCGLRMFNIRNKRSSEKDYDYTD